MQGDEDPLDMAIKECNVFLMYYPMSWDALMEMPASRFQVMADDLTEHLKEQQKAMMGGTGGTKEIETFGRSFPKAK